MSERPKGDPFANLDAFIADANDVDVVEDEVVEADGGIKIPEKLKKRRVPTPLPKKAKLQNINSEKTGKPAEPTNPYGYSEVDLKDHLVEDDSDLTKVGEWLDDEIAAGPEFKSTFETVDVDKEEVETEIKLNETASESESSEEASTEEDILVGFSRDTNARRKLRRKLADRRIEIEDEKNEKGVKFQSDLRSRAGQIEKKRKLESESEIVEADFEDITDKKPEKKEKAKTAVELAMEKTQIVADKYNEKKLKKEDIAKAKYIDDLLAVIDSSEGLQGSREYFDKDKLRMIVEMVRDGQLGYEYLTRSGGLRQKVFDILNKPKKVAKPKEGQPIEEPVEIEKEFVVEDAEQITPLPEDKTSDKVLEFEKKNKRVGITKEGVSPMLIKDAQLSKEIEDHEREVGKVRRSYVFALRKYQDDFKKFSEAGPFKRFWMKITSAGERLNDAQVYSEQMEIEYRRQIDSLIEQKTELKFVEISSLRANSPERKKYGKVTNIDLINFINTRINKPLPEKFKNLSDQERWMPIDIKQIVAENILSKKEAGDLMGEIIKLEIKKEIADEVARDEKEVLNRKLADGL